MEITAYLILFKYLYYNYTDKNNVQWLDASGSLRLTPLHLATRSGCVSQHKMFHWVQNLKRTRSMKNQKYIYSVFFLQEFTKPLWSQGWSPSSFSSTLNESVTVAAVTFIFEVDKTDAAVVNTKLTWRSHFRSKHIVCPLRAFSPHIQFDTFTLFSPITEVLCYLSD